MIDQLGRWFPDYPGQQPYQDPAYYRGMRQNVPPQPQQPQYSNQQFNGQQYNHSNAPVQGNFIRVPSEQVARNWNVQPGMSVTFIDENAPYCYTKTVDISQLDRPRFEKYRLVKEEDAPVSREKAPEAQAPDGSTAGPRYALQDDVDRIWGELAALKRRVDSRKREDAPHSGRKEVVTDGESSD